MVRHIVFWKLQAQANGKPAAENGRKMVELLLALKDKVPGALALEAGVDINRSPAAWDVALYTQFPDKATLDAYQVHPEHLKVVAFIKSVTMRSSLQSFFHSLAPTFS